MLGLLCHHFPARIVIGELYPDVHQPIWFDESQQNLDANGSPVGLKRTNGNTTYSEMDGISGPATLTEIRPPAFPIWETYHR